jgi:hypothetical protein
MINTINNKVFRNANEAYEYMHDKIIQHGVDFGDTKALFNVGFYITDPKDRKIVNTEREWNQDYAEAEWQWYLSGDPNVKALGIYTVKFLKYGNVWPIIIPLGTVKLILIMAISGSVINSLIMYLFT